MQHSYDGFCRRDKVPKIMYAYKGTFDDGKMVVKWTAEVSLDGAHKGNVAGTSDGTVEINMIRRGVEEATKRAINDLEGMVE